MKKYSLTYKTWMGQWECARFKATCDTDARFIARSIFRDNINRWCGGYTLTDFFGNYIEM